ncbi:substrate-binding domain-containing protein [Psychrobacillus psychrodurans]|jgi:phosphate transport system substrate-binding protein|uniref:PstS family phosphate ABC transporter substrate-binding protein n=1 Tax=Psychrobacillus TaxID=1221880 RepID=UPI001F4E0209|nr:substrate-binding domain-containing protein [Psychrobacillus psychrodurans]MCK1999136.1 substrate-binding domain-containing protein [Psychrobacillus psychrodurans]
MKVESKIGGVILSIFALIGMVFFVFVGLFFVLIMGGIDYIALLITGGVVLYVLFVFNIFHFFQTKKRKIIFGSLAGAAILISAIAPIKDIYTHLIPTVDAEVDIAKYEPFSQFGNVTTLNEKATLQLTDDLPRLDGATALYPLYAAIVEATYPEKSYPSYNSEVLVSTTPYAYENLFSGKVDMIFAAAPSESQKKIAEQKGLELTMTPIGREAFVFFVNQKNPVDNLTVDQITDIYTGKVSSWEQLGGKNDPIRAFQRPEDSGSQSALQSLMKGMPLMDPPSKDIVTGMGGIINEVSQYRNYKNAIGFTFRFYSTEMVGNDQIKLLEINGVAPTKENIRAETYPITSELYIVTAGTDNSNVEPLIEWILSDQGQALVEKVGYVPISE